MVIVQLMGGLGSQMSQYAFAKALQQRGCEVTLDVSHMRHYKLHDLEVSRYPIDLPIATRDQLERFRPSNPLYRLLDSTRPNNFILRTLRRLGYQVDHPSVLRENSHLFNRAFLDVSGDIYLIGDFKSEKYFRGVRETLLRQFVITEPRSSYFIRTLDSIKNAGVSCFIHARRGDFANDRKTKKIHGVCDPAYYEMAASYVRSEFPGCSFFIFSNDIPWCRDNLNIERSIFVENEGRLCPHEDIELMSQCSHAVIDHSAFCWWGAWLNKSPEQIVVGPSRWFASDHLEAQSDDIYCEKWHRLRD